MLFHPAKVLLKAFSILFNILSTYCDLYPKFYFKGVFNGRNIKSQRLVPREVDTTFNQVKPEAAMRPRGAYFFSPKTQEWIKIKF